MVLKRLIFSNKRKKARKILLLGHSVLTDALAIYLNKKNIRFTYIRKNVENDILFNEKIFIPEKILNELGFYSPAKEIKFILFIDNILFPVINSLNFFKEVYLNLIGKKDDIEKFEEFFEKNFIFQKEGINYFYKNFSPIFADIIYSILFFYNFRQIEALKIDKIKEALNNFFENNVWITKKKLSDIFNKYLETTNINMTIVPEERYLKVKNLTVIVGNRIVSFDFLITDFVEFVKDRQKVSFSENLIEFKIKKDYVSEYFPKNLVIKTEDGLFVHLELFNQDEKFKFFKLRNCKDINAIFLFFKKYYPELNEQDLIIEKECLFKLNSFIFKKEEYPFNYYSKVNEYIKYIDKNIDY